VSNPFAWNPLSGHLGGFPVQSDAIRIAVNLRAPASSGNMLKSTCFPHVNDFSTNDHARSRRYLANTGRTCHYDAHRDEARFAYSRVRHLRRNKESESSVEDIESETVRTAPAPPTSHHLAAPRRSTVYRLAERTWWLPWLIGAAVVVVGAITAVEVITGADEVPDEQQSTGYTRHVVVYAVTGTGSSPEIRYVTDGMKEVGTVRSVPLPWRAELAIEVGPGSGVVQVVATRINPVSPISCSLEVDGKPLYSAEAAAGSTSVSCSAVIGRVS
jgi:hypothetical protein